MAGSTFNPRPKSINEVVDYILVKLGKQLLEINVTEEQILDRISDAIVYFQEHHIDGTFEGFFKVIIQPSKLVITSALPNNITFCKGDVVTGPAGFSALIHSISENRLEIALTDVVGTLSAGNTVTIGTNDPAITRTVTSLTLGPADLGYIEIPENVEAIVEVLQVPTSGALRPADGQSTTEFNLSFGLGSGYNPYSRYLAQFYQYAGSSLGISFYMQNLRSETMRWMTTLEPWADFNRLLNRAYLNNYDYKANIGNYLVLKVMTAVDPEVYPEMYGDTWFLRYATELVRRQWGENLQKFQDVTLLNGVKVDGKTMVDQAETRIKELEDEMWSRYREPDDFFLA